MNPFGKLIYNVTNIRIIIVLLFLFSLGGNNIALCANVTSTNNPSEVFLASSNGFNYYGKSDEFVQSNHKRFTIKMEVEEHGQALINKALSQAGLILEKYQNLNYVTCEVVVLNRSQIEITRETYVDKQGRIINDWQSDNRNSSEPPTNFIAEKCREFIINYFSFK